MSAPASKIDPRLRRGPWAPRVVGPAAEALSPSPRAPFPPDNVEVVGGTWGVDFDEDTETLVSGERSIIFQATTPAESPSIQFLQQIDAHGGGFYTGEVVWRVGRADPGDTMEAVVDWYDREETYMSSSTIYAAAVLATVGAFQSCRVTVEAPDGARGARVRVTKAPRPFQAWLDSWDLTPAVARGHYLVSGAAIATYGFPPAPAIPFDTVLAEYGITLDTSTGIVTCNTAGVYVVSCTVSVDDAIDNGAFIDALPTQNGTYLAADLRYNWSGGALAGISASPHAVMICEAGDTFEIRMIHTHGSDRHFTGVLHIVRVE